MTNYKKSEENIVFSFIAVSILIVLLTGVAVYKIVELSEITQKFQKHSLVVINATQHIQTQIVSMHRYMKDVVLSVREKELQEALAKVQKNEEKTYKDFQVVFKNYLGDKKQVQASYDLFKNWKKIRTEIVELMHQGRVREAIAITKAKGYRHVKKLNKSIEVLVKNAQQEGRLFVQTAEDTKNLSISIIIAVSMVILVLVMTIVILLIKALNKEESQRKEQERQFLSHSRLAQIGELISMIAHQWRQPLGAIASTSIDLKMKIELGVYDLEDAQQRKLFNHYMTNGLDQIDAFVLTLTTTIDDFRDFYKPNKVITLDKVNAPIEKTLSIIGNSLKAHNIILIQHKNAKKKIEYFSNEMMQVLLNIFKNAEDNFMAKKAQDATIWIRTEDTEYGVDIEICDNGGGIDEKFISKIFDPYFSTKQKKNGTGLGLYMSQTIVREHHNGRLSAHNTGDGVCFTISLNDKVTNR